MSILRCLIAFFIDIFGITHPSEKNERRAVWYITSLLLLVFLLIGGIVFAIGHQLQR